MPGQDASAGSAAGTDAAPAASQPSTGNAPAVPETPFVDVTAASNISYRVGYTQPSLIGRDLEGALIWQLTTMTIGGAAAGDCDRDGDIDLFVTYGNTGGPDGGGGPNRLYLNQLAEQGKGLVFEDFAAEAGVANTRPDGRNDRQSGPAFADMDGDGDLDLFIGGIYDDPNKIYANRGDCTFEDVTSNSPDIVDMLASSTVSAGFGDYDLDGDLDMFLTHWGTRDDLYGEPRNLQTDHLWRNDSDASGIRYVNVSGESGISEMTWQTRGHMFCGLQFCQDNVGQVQIADFTFTPTFARINDDLWPDILIAADFGTTQIALNQGDGTFRNFASSVLREAQFGMGSAVGDIDNDGDLDWFVTSILGPGNEYFTPHGNRLFLNDGTTLVDATDRFGVADGSFGWGACFIDIDNDTDLDIYHTNGYPGTYISDYDGFDTDPSRVFVMNDAGTYDERAEALGLATTTSGRGVVCADFDNDGDIDIFELTDAPGNSARLWENRTAAEGRNFLRIKLEGLPPNTEAAGARIRVRLGDLVQTREITIGSNYTSQNPTVQIFGLGSAETVDEIFVAWPPTDSGEGPVQLGSLL
ncbi:MAG: CRTAC1 family protein, partial [Gammaproteobacteria bacterium]|nr:CRTAC1 family protein [Gammaproteobacteria bacterium]